MRELGVGLSNGSQDDMERTVRDLRGILHAATPLPMPFPKKVALPARAPARQIFYPRPRHEAAKALGFWPEMASRVKSKLISARRCRPGKFGKNVENFFGTLLSNYMGYFFFEPKKVQKVRIFSRKSPGTPNQVGFRYSGNFA